MTLDDTEFCGRGPPTECYRGRSYIESLALRLLTYKGELPLYQGAGLVLIYLIQGDFELCGIRQIGRE